jgi:metal-responsive CopG/Arc/MetJ family transcriptional regulator
MKTKTSITLSTPLLVQVDRLIGKGGSRSAFIEKAVRAYIRDAVRHALQKRDQELINAAAERLNEEAEEVLRYQASSL